MSSKSTNLLDLIVSGTHPSKEQLATYWNDVMEEAEVAMKPMPHDDSEDVDILSYLRNVQSAVAAITDVVDYAKRHGMTTPEIPPNLTALFQDGVNFLNANYPKYAH